MVSFCFDMFWFGLIYNFRSGTNKKKYEYEFDSMTAVNILRSFIRILFVQNKALVSNKVKQHSVVANRSDSLNLNYPELRSHMAELNCDVEFSDVEWNCFEFFSGASDFQRHKQYHPAWENHVLDRNATSNFPYYGRFCCSSSPST